MTFSVENIKAVTAASLEAELNANACGLRYEGFKIEAMFILEANPTRPNAPLLCHRVTERNCNIIVDQGNGLASTVPLSTWLQKLASYPPTRTLVLLPSTLNDVPLVPDRVSRHSHELMKLVPTLTATFDPFEL